jgi:hypothetical protein
MLRTYGLDANAKRMPLSGADWAFRSDIYTTLPFTFEVKNQERMNFWDWWEQARSQEKPMKPAVLIHSGNYRPIMASMDVMTFINILVELNQWKEEAMSWRDDFKNKVIK